MHETYDKLIALLDANKASYRLIDHLPEGQTDKVSALRGHPVEAAAKSIVLIVKIGKKTSRFVLAVIPGDARVDTGKIKSLFSGATYAGFAATDVAERLAGSVAGTVLPFATAVVGDNRVPAFVVLSLRDVAAERRSPAALEDTTARTALDPDLPRIMGFQQNLRAPHQVWDTSRFLGLHRPWMPINPNLPRPTVVV
jgi:prolyl-tRNA editing enzyme YbaK/EbsC (Cys-tRNA(Pro) deacylase)